MNALFLHLGLERFKPFVTALLLPPVPFLILALFGVWLLRRRSWRRTGTGLVVASLAALWLSACMATAERVMPLVLDIPPPLDGARIAAMRKDAGGPVAIIVLGGGVEAWAPEYGTSSLGSRSLERLRYGVWLGRQTGWRVGFSGGLGWGQPPGAAREAIVAQRIATDEFKAALTWVESDSRDTRENARQTVDLLRTQGIRRIVLVTHGWHMPRSVRNFERAGGGGMSIEAAPIGLAGSPDWPWLQWVPSGEGLVQARAVAREWLGLLGGA